MFLSQQCKNGQLVIVYVNSNFAKILYLFPIRDAGTGGAGGAAAPLAFCWEGQGGQKCPLGIKNII